MKFSAASLVPILFQLAAGTVFQGPHGNYEGRWRSSSITAALGNVLRIAANTPGFLTDAGLRYWDYDDASGNTFRVLVDEGVESIGAAVCNLADQAFNALTSNGNEYERVGVITDAGAGILFIVNPIHDANREATLAIEKANSSAPAEQSGTSKSGNEKRSIDTPHCFHPNTRDLSDALHAEEPRDGTSESDEATRTRAFVRGAIGDGCAGENVYIRSDTDHCYRTAENQAVSFWVDHGHNSHEKVVVYSDKHCQHKRGPIQGDFCLPTRTYGSYKILRE